MYGWDGYSGAPEIVAQFEPSQVPVHTALAEEFAVFDKYYTSFPGPSTPNHLFIMSATAYGCTYTGVCVCVCMCVHVREGPTVDDLLRELVLV